VTVRFAGLISGVMGATFLLVGFNYVSNWKQEKAKLALAGWFMVSGGILVLALVLGYTRGTLGSMPRYSILAAPFAAILLVLLNLQRARMVRVGHGVVVLTVLLVLPLNVIEGLRFGRERRAVYERVMADYRRGAGFDAIAQYYDSNHTMATEIIAEYLEGLHQRRLSVFGHEPFVPQGARAP